MGKRDEIMRQITLLEDRDTSRFMYESLQLFGDVGDALVTDANELLEAIPVQVPQDSHVTASAFAETAERELDLYRDRYPGFAAEMDIRSDVSDLRVSHGRFLVPASAVFRSKRVDALIQHEVGTHVVTYENGRAQPLKLLTVGLPGYDETQEGLALLSEFVSGGLDPARLRLLAARVVAVDRIVGGADFLEIFEELREKHSLAPKTAWGIAIRVARSGGLTKDVIYLRGITRVLEFVSQRKTIEPLLVGKLSLDDVPLVEELIERGILRPPWIRPRWTEGRRAQERLARAYDGMRVRDLIEKGAVA
ncbi:MAG: tyrosine/phenylalanine carboxypeptidase domain-containing protein [Actinomycetota bacterium]